MKRPPGVADNGPGLSAPHLMGILASPATGRLFDPFRAMVLLLILLFFLGGGSRGDIQSLVVLRPLSALLLGYGLSQITATQIRRHRFLFGMALAMIVLVAVQLIPLPPSIWTRLPGRALIVDIDQTARLGTIWRPVSLTPSATWNALFALIPPLAILTLGAQLTSDDRWRLLPIVIGLGLMSGILAVLQLGGSGSSPLYFYQVTNEGAAVGFFANRNHQAILIASLLPMLAAYASGDMPSGLDARIRAVIAAAIGMFLIPLILVTGSRAGLLAAGLGLLSIALLYRFPRRRGSTQGNMARWMLPALAGIVAVIGLSLITILLGRAEAFDRITAYANMRDIRYLALRPVMEMTRLYFPIGSGFGSFPDVFRVYEPSELLNPNYFNHAHNDWLEAIFTGGLPAGLLLGIATFAFFSKAVNLVRADRDRDQVMASLGICVVLLFAMSSITDYPLRVPSLAGVFCVAAIWANAFNALSRQ